MPDLSPLLAGAGAVPGHLKALPWPATGEGAVALVGAGLMAATPGPIVPIASLTKMMTALIVLRDHPLVPGEQGLELRMGPADVAAYVRASQTDESNVPIRNGEVLSEYQLLEALLLPSADNVANELAIWDAGSVARFVAKMNAEAAALGLSSTHYADASGVDPGSRSTAGNQALLAAQLMTNPVVRTIVRQRVVTFPVAGSIYNVNPALGVDGIIGVKSGYTSEAQGCLATAVFANVGGRSQLLVAVSLHQPDGLYGAARADEALLGRAASELVVTDPLALGAPVARVSEPWSAVVGTARLSASSAFVGWPGLRYNEVLTPVSPRPGSTEVATLSLVTSDGLLASVPVTAADLPAMPAGWSPPGS